MITNTYNGVEYNFLLSDISKFDRTPVQTDEGQKYIYTSMANLLKTNDISGYKYKDLIYGFHMLYNDKFNYRHANPILPFLEFAEKEFKDPGHSIVKFRQYFDEQVNEENEYIEKYRYFDLTDSDIDYMTNGNPNSSTAWYCGEILSRFFKKKDLISYPSKHFRNTNVIRIYFGKEPFEYEMGKPMPDLLEFILAKNKYAVEN
jgi:hypothetical protein